MPVLSVLGLNRTLYSVFLRQLLNSNSPPLDRFQNVGPLFIKMFDPVKGRFPCLLHDIPTKTAGGILAFSHIYSHKAIMSWVPNDTHNYHRPCTLSIVSRKHSFAEVLLWPPNFTASSATNNHMTHEPCWGYV